MPTQITLSDVQSLELSARLAAIIPAKAGRSHRMIVREFIETVFDITGKLYPITAYETEFDKHFPDRSPSRATFASELKSIRDEIASIKTATVELNAAKREDLSNIVKIAVADALAKYFPVLDSSTQVIDANKVIEFFQSELSQKEQQCRALSAANVALKAKLHAASMLYDKSKEQEKAFNEQINEHAQSMNKMLVEIDGQRRYAMQSIEAVRGETRSWKERYETLAAQQRKDKSLLEHFRRLAYQRGAPIPDQLLDGQSE